MPSPLAIIGMEETSTIKPCQKFEGHTDDVDTAIILPDGQRMITCSRDDSLRLWNVKNGKQIGKDYRDGDINIELRTIALSPDGKKGVSGSWDGQMRMWDIDTGKVIGKWTGHTNTVRSVCWSRDGRRVVSGSYDGTARQWDVEKGETILSPIETGHVDVYAAVYSPNMTMFATAGSNCRWDLDILDDYEYEDSVKVWNTNTGKLVATLNGHAQMVNCLAWTSDGETLVSGSNDSWIIKWNTTTWKQMAKLEHVSNIDIHLNFFAGIASFIVYDIAISPNGRILAIASFEPTARLWNLDDNQPINSPSLQHAHSAVTCVSFSPDGKLLITGGDHNVCTWDVTAILKEAGLDDLLLDKRLLAADATQRPPRQPIKVLNRVPQGFFDDTPPLSPRHQLQHGTTLRDYFLSLFRRIHPDTSSQHRPFHWIRNRLSGRPSEVDIDLHQHPSAIIDVPYAKGKRRNACAREKRRPILKNPTTSTSGPPNNNATQQSAQVQSSSQTQPQVAIPTSSTTPAPITSNTNPHAMIKHASRWTRFWLFICCASPEYTDGHH